jgi:outer membrane lipoprotein-sorting protein
MSKFLFLVKILFALSVIAFAQTNSITNHNWTIAKANTLPSLVLAPSLQKEQPIKEAISEQTTLPLEIQNAVFEDLSKHTSQNVATFRIAEAEKLTWSDGCLGLAKPDQFCTQVLTPGWQVVVTDGEKQWVYRTNSSGSLVKLAK